VQRNPVSWRRRNRCTRSRCTAARVDLARPPPFYIMGNKCLRNNGEEDEHGYNAVGSDHVLEIRRQCRISAGLSLVSRRVTVSLTRRGYMSRVSQNDQRFWRAAINSKKIASGAATASSSVTADVVMWPLTAPRPLRRLTDISATLIIYLCRSAMARTAGTVV